MVDLNPPGARPLVLAVHGTTHAPGVRVSEELRDRVAGWLPGVGVHLGWADLLSPTLTETLTALGPCVVVPVFLTTGYHVTSDVPDAIATSGGQAILTSRVGDGLLAAVEQRLLEAGGPGDAVVLGHAGSKRAESVAEVRSAARRLAVRLGRPVEAAFLTAAEPTVPDAVAALRARGLREISVASYLLAPGVFHNRLRAMAPGVVGDPIGAHRLLVEDIVRRYLDAVGGDDRAALAAASVGGTAGDGGAG